MTFALPSFLEAILNPEFKKSGKTGSARLPRGMKLGNKVVFHWNFMTHEISPI